MPLRYFEWHGLPPDWPTFLEDFQRHWRTDGAQTYVDFVRDGLADNGAARSGNARWSRLAEERARSAQSVFHLDVQGQVAKATRYTAVDRPASWPRYFPMVSRASR